MDEDWLKDNLPDLEAPWEPEEKEDDDDGGPGFWLFNHNKRKKHVKRAHVRKALQYRKRSWGYTLTKCRKLS